MPEKCPIDESTESLEQLQTRYQLSADASQDYIDRPSDSVEIDKDLDADLRTYYRLKLEGPPRGRAEYHIIRTKRSAAMAAFYHISATSDEVNARESKSDFQYPQTATTDVELSLMEYSSPPLRQFVSEMKLYLEGIWSNTWLDMSAQGDLAEYHALTGVLSSRHAEFSTVDKTGALLATNSAVFGNFGVIAEDTADTVMRHIIRGELVRELSAGAAHPTLSSDFALRHRKTLGALASVSREFEVRTDPLGKDDGDTAGHAGVRESIFQYESAHAANLPTGFDNMYVYNQASDELAAVGLIQQVPWDQPRFCPAYPELTSYNDPNVRFRSVETSIAVGARIAERTIFAHWPGVL
jgi:hypothetical protein